MDVLLVKNWVSSNVLILVIMLYKFKVDVSITDKIREFASV